MKVNGCQGDFGWLYTDLYHRLILISWKECEFQGTASQFNCVESTDLSESTLGLAYCFAVARLYVKKLAQLI